MPITIEEAARLTEKAKRDALGDVLVSYVNPSEIDEITTKLLAALETYPRTMPDDCDQEHSTYGKCELEYGHEGTCYTYSYDDDRRPDGSHPWDY